MLNKIDSHFKHLTLLSMLYTAVLLISVLLDYKFISIGSMLASSATFVISITFFLGDVIAEVYGYQIAKRVVWSGVICLLCFSSMGYLLEKLPTPSEYEKYGMAYHTVLNLLFRASISNSVAILIGAFFNIYFVSKWKMLVKGKYFWLRSLGSSALGEALYTVIVVTFLNIGIVSLSHFTEILVISYLYKLIFDTVAVIPASIVVAALKQAEGVDIYDFPNSLTPFKYRYAKL